MNYQDPFIKDIHPAIKNAVEGIQSTVDIAIIGLSGGADSTLCACICKEALGAENVIGVSMPYGATDLATFNARSCRLAEKLGIQHRVASIGGPMNCIEDTLTEQVCSLVGTRTIDPFVLGNTRSRLRMLYLYAVSGSLSLKYPHKRVRVIGTGNLSEDYIGYDTKWGDGACDVFPISDFLKREVYMALDDFRDIGVISEDLIERIPSAGLWDGQTDEGELGYTYDAMAPAVLYCKEFMEHNNAIELPEDLQKVVDFVWNRHKANSHKLRPEGFRTIIRSFEV